MVKHTNHVANIGLFLRYLFYWTKTLEIFQSSELPLINCFSWSDLSMIFWINCVIWIPSTKSFIDIYLNFIWISHFVFPLWLWHSLYLLMDCFNSNQFPYLDWLNINFPKICPGPSHMKSICFLLPGCQWSIWRWLEIFTCSNYITQFIL